MILPIYIYGQPVLRQEAADIDANYPDLKQLTADMFETLKQADGVGLAAPQVGLPIRLVVIDLSPMGEDIPEYKDFKKVCINPQIEEYDDTKTDVMEEGCLSLPGIHEPVRRPTRIRVTYCDENFQPHNEWVDGFLARVMQHEFDHLDGHVFTDRISPLRRQLVKGKLGMLLKGKVHASYKVKRAQKGHK